MKPAALIAVVASLLFGPAIQAQTSGIIMPNPTAACRPTPTLEELIKALDEAVSGPVDKDRTCLRELLLPDAHLVPTAKSADGTYTPHPLTVDGWIDRVKARGGNVYEHQVKVTTETYGHIAHLWSTYELRTAADGPVQIRGINSIQALYDGKRWRIYQIFWQAETADEKVPAKYLP
jgi:hypothetical protein